MAVGDPHLRDNAQRCMCLVTDFVPSHKHGIYCACVIVLLKLTMSARAECPDFNQLQPIMISHEPLGTGAWELDKSMGQVKFGAAYRGACAQALLSFLLCPKGTDKCCTMPMS